MDLKTVPVLPSLITLGNVFLGFLAMAKVADAVWLGPGANPEVMHIFEIAALLVFAAMVLDALDGRVARTMNQTSAFGAQLDSLADVVTFGVAPAFIVKVMINFHDGEPVPLLPAHPKIYYFCAAVYVLCAAMRLARFNVESGPSESDHREFKGLPTPGAAAMICALVAFVAGRGDTDNIVTRNFLPDYVYDALIVAMPATLVCVGLLMISKLPFPHMFYILMRQRHSFPFLATLVIVIGLAAVEWQLALLVLTFGYAVSGIGLGTYRLITTGRMGPPPPASSSGSSATEAMRRIVEPKPN